MAHTSAPVPEITNLDAQLVPAGVSETDFIVQGFGFIPSSIVEVNGVPQQTAYDNSTFLTATLAASSIPANSYGELAVTVVTPGAASSAPYTLTEFQIVPTENAFMIYEPVSKRLFASTPAAATTNPNTVLPINPVNATAGTPIPVGHDPGVLAASADGKFLYVGLNADHTIQRINAGNTVDRTFQLPVDAEFGSLSVIDMHVVPGSDTEVVASLMIAASGGPDGIAFFNDSGLVNWIPGPNQGVQPPTISVDGFTFTNNPSTLYAIMDTYNPGLAELTYSAAGLQDSGNSCCVPTGGNRLATDGTLLYTQTGLAWNPASGGQIVDTYPIPAYTVMDSVIPDVSTGKTYYLNLFGQYFEYSATTILAFDKTSLMQTGSLSFANGYGAQLVRWGTNGFAFRASDQIYTTGTSIILLTSSIASASNLNPAPVAIALAPASIPAAGPDFVLTINGSGFVAGSTVEWNGSPRPTTVVSPTQLTATIYASDIATTGSTQVVVQSPGPGGGTSAALPVTISPTLPQVTSISPNYGAPAALITIIGSNFGATQGNGSVTVGGAPSYILSWSNTAITIQVPSNASTGNIVVTAGGEASNGASFTFYPYPAITGLSPASGAAGTRVTITGTGLLDGEGNGTVTFNGTATTILSKTSTSIQVDVPTNASTGPVTVRVNGDTAKSSTFLVIPTPQISGINPSYGAPAALIKITGTNFGATPGSVTVGGAPSYVVSWSNTAIAIQVPSHATSGNIVVSAGGVTSNGEAFTFYPYPAITGVSPASGAVGTPVTITGTGLLDGEGNAAVTFNGTPAPILSQTSTSIQVEVPAGATSGPISVQANGDTVKTSTNFTVTHAQISGISPNYGAPAALITITGTNFGTTRGNGSVTVGGAPSYVVSWSNTAIAIEVPSRATTGNIVVTTEGEASNGALFTSYGEHLDHRPCWWTAMPVGTSVTITGNNLQDGGNPTPSPSTELRPQYPATPAEASRSPYQLAPRADGCSSRSMASQWSPHPASPSP